jgi:hypothetical protein
MFPLPLQSTHSTLCLSIGTAWHRLVYSEKQGVSVRLAVHCIIRHKIFFKLIFQLGWSVAFSSGFERKCKYKTFQIHIIISKWRCKRYKSLVLHVSLTGIISVPFSPSYVEEFTDFNHCLYWHYADINKVPTKTTRGCEGKLNPPLWKLGCFN